jgi:hypothetical protein
VWAGATDGGASGAQLRNWADQQGLPVDTLHGPGAGAGFDGALEYLAATAGRATAVSAAKMIDYPTSSLDLAEGAAGPRMPLLVVLGLLLTAAVGCLPTVVRRALRRRSTVGAGRGAANARPESTHLAAAGARPVPTSRGVR